MIVSSQHQILLHKNYSKILYLHPASNNTYVFLACRAYNTQVLVHCNKNGKILKQITFEDPTTSMACFNPHEAIILQTRKHMILLVQLRKGYKTMDIPFLFKRQQSEYSKIDTFNQSKLICIREQGQSGNHCLKLSYFSPPLNQNSKPLAVYESLEGEWSHDYLLKKGNEQSLYLWCKPRHSSYFRVTKLRLEKDSNGTYEAKLNTYEISISNLSSECKIQIGIISIWEMTQGKLLIGCLFVSKQSSCFEQGDKIWLVYDTQKVHLAKLSYEFPKNIIDYQIETCNMGLCSMFPTYFFSNGKSQPSPIIYLNNKNQQFFHEQKWQCSHLSKNFISAYEQNTVYQCEYDNADISSVNLIRKSILNLRILGIIALQSVYDNFDEDLIKETVELLPLYGIQ